MRSQWRRLGLAALLSCGSAGGTLFWYKSTERNDFGNGNEAPLAQVSQVGDEVLRRPATRLLWQSVNTGDNLYNGETIRTSSRGELRIQFEDGRYIDLESDSLIVLQKSKGEIALDLMEGSLFVNAKSEEGGEAPGLVLNSKNGKVDLSGASASLSKGSGDSLDLQVLEGKAKIQGADGQAKEIGTGKSSSLGASGLGFKSSDLQILSPLPQKPYFIDPDDAQPVSFRWKGFPADWKVTLLAGPSRREMKEVAQAEPGSSQIDARLPLGKYFWKLTAKDPASGQLAGESAVNRLEVEARYAPTVIFPLADAEIPVEKPPFDMNFKWQKSEDAKRVVLEVAADPKLKNRLVNKQFTSEDSMALPGLEKGEYYWRMSAYYEGVEKPVVGKIQKFTLLGAIKKDPVEIAWTLPEEKLTQLFAINPALEMSWQPKNRQEDIARYSLKLESEDQPAAAPMKVDLTGTQYKASLPRAGRFIASVEAYDKDGTMIGQSPKRSLTAAELPLIPAPILQPAEGDLRTGNDGRTELQWLPVQGAKEYQLTVTDKSGKQLANKRYDRTSTNLKNLLPGEYGVRVLAIDEHGRPSQEAPVRKLVVPDKSGVKAPSLKKIKVN